ncbi:uncharacterized protein LOC127749667 [Frankliniella occidentalis]|uniref:Uncharacterized protein LOC127749667 n=1 Tax=Frankliniella occidentalis TaxID=133901 RepID=A0A9C6WZD5_FRAOC|nr:uncharacterized protein LOC127749667 [Frankliniella occidentalis]
MTAARGLHRWPRPIGSTAHLVQVEHPASRAAYALVELRWPALLLQLVVVALTSQLRVNGGVINSFAGPYIVYVERFYHCGPPYDKLPWKWNFHITRFNPKTPKEIQRLNGNITAGNGTYDNAGWAKLNLDIMSNNQWKENNFIFEFKKRGCQNMKDHVPFVYEAFFNKGKESKNAECKIEPGFYDIKNAAMTWVFPKFPVMPYGHYRARFIAGNKIPFGCWVAESRVIPRYD